MLHSWKRTPVLALKESKAKKNRSNFTIRHLEWRAKVAVISLEHGLEKKACHGPLDIILGNPYIVWRNFYEKDDVLIPLGSPKVGSVLNFAESNFARPVELIQGISIVWMFTILNKLNPQN